MSHICSRCNKDFKYESILKRHINKKKTMYYRNY